MLPLILGLVLFFAVHLVPTSPAFRDGIKARFGDSTYKIGFALLSTVGLVLIVLGYQKLVDMPGKNVDIWTPPEFMRHINFLLMIPAIILLVASQIPSRIRTAAKHPMLAGIKLWALAHLLVNGDLGSMLLFGSFLAYGVYDRISVKRRGITGPARPYTGGPINDVIVVALGLAIYAGIMFWGHAYIIGKPIVNVAFAP